MSNLFKNKENKEALKGSLSGFDSFLSNDVNEVPAIMVNLADLHEFGKGNPFSVVDEQLADLVESIKENGVIEPGIVRPRKKGGYELISGHRRCRACKLAGLSEMPVRVMEFTDDEATVIMVDANLHREVILPSEKAKSYAMKFEALKHQGKGGNGSTLNELSESSGEGEKTIQRYIQLARLNDTLLSLVDSGAIPFMAGVELSALKEEYQEWIVRILDENDIEKISLSQAGQIKAEAKEHYLSVSDIVAILLPEKKEKPKVFKFKQNRVSEYFPPDTTPEEIERTIYELLDDWKKLQKLNHK